MSVASSEAPLNASMHFACAGGKIETGMSVTVAAISQLNAIQWTVNVTDAIRFPFRVQCWLSTTKKLNFSNL